MRVVLDTNVIVSGLNFPGSERLVLELALRGRFEASRRRSNTPLNSGRPLLQGNIGSRCSDGG